MGIPEPDLLSEMLNPSDLMLILLLVVVLSEESTNPLQDASDAAVGSGISGFLGLGTNRGPAPNGTNVYKPAFLDSIFGQWLKTHPTAENFTFGMLLEPPVMTPKNFSSPDTKIPLPTKSSAGTLHWLETDPSFYRSDQVSYATVDYGLASSMSSVTDPQDWVVGFDGWTATVTTGGKATTQVSLRDTITANVDPMYQGIYIPLTQATTLRMSDPLSVLLSLLISITCNPVR